MTKTAQVQPNIKPLNRYDRILILLRASECQNYDR